MDVSLFDFELPESHIALRPARPRDHARFLIVNPGRNLTDSHVYNLPNHLRAGDVLVLNETRVLPAALTGRRPARAHGGGGDVSLTVNLHKHLSETAWRAFVKPAKRLREGDIIHFSDQLSAHVKDKQAGGDIGLEFNLSGSALSAQIEAIGAPPLPPYIARQRPADEKDVQDYQTIYARVPDFEKDSEKEYGDGSVAAPTAGLHFTDELFRALQSRGVQIERLTLHVGAGTFLPMKSDDTDDHHMHSEWFEISPEIAARLNKAKSEQRRIIAVGTTALRALESAGQSGRLEPCARETDIFITPGYAFKIIDGLMTNFHLPKSTLFMLVSALSGLENMQAAYAHAVKTGYRFYSYGDSSLLWNMSDAGFDGGT